MKLLIGLLLFVPLLIWSGYRIQKGVAFDRYCGGYIDRAAHANAVETTEAELKTALAWIEQHGLTEGYTSVLWTTPDEDVGFWYKNLQAGLTELQSLRPDSTALEKSNVLMRLREALSRTPDGISVYPYNAFWFWFGWLSLIAAIAGAVLCFMWLDETM